MTNIAHYATIIQSIIFLLSDTTIHIFIGAYHFEEGRTT